MRTLLACLLVLIAFPVVGADAPADGKAVLDQAIEAAKAVENVHFKVKIQPEGVIANFIGAAEAEGVLAGWDPEINLPAKFWTRLTTTLPRTTDPVTYTGGSNGEMFYLVDHTNKKGYEDIDPGVFGSAGQVLNSAVPISLVNDSPYSQDAAGESFELLENATVGGVECYTVKVVFGEANFEKEAILHFGTEDLLPRRMVRHYDVSGQGTGKLILDFDALDPNPTLDAKRFSMTLPEGFEQIDDFAP
ncbi:MAG: hypothetical protein AAGD38_13415 [Acidobacteriota bacterium]